MFSTLAKIGTTILCALSLVGCASQCVTIQSNGDSGANIGSTFNRQVSVSMASSRIAGALEQAKVQFSNKTSSTQQVRYRFNWFDSDGFGQGQSTAWQPVSIGPNQSQVVSSISPTTQAARFNIQVCQ